MGYKMTKRDVERTFLSKEELQCMRDEILINERLSQVSEVFVPCCFTGLAYADVKKLNRSEICVGVNGDEWISQTARKGKGLRNSLAAFCTGHH